LLTLATGGWGVWGHRDNEASHAGLHCGRLVVVPHQLLPRVINGKGGRGLGDGLVVVPHQRLHAQATVFWPGPDFYGISAMSWRLRGQISQPQRRPNHNRNYLRNQRCSAAAATPRSQPVPSPSTPAPAPAPAPPPHPQDLHPHPNPPPHPSAPALHPHPNPHPYRSRAHSGVSRVARAAP
jgi:hypothetical protein